MVANMAITRVVILAAGKGKRMGSEMPKPLVRIAGEPMLAHLMRNVGESGVDARPVVVVAPDAKDLFVDALADTCDFALQTEQLGTGHAVLSAKEMIGDADRVMVLYGDHPFIPAHVLRGLVELHDANTHAVAMLTCTVPSFDAPYDIFKSWGRVLRDDTGEVVAIREAKDASVGELAVREVNPAMYLFPTAWMWERLPLLGTANASGEMYLTDLIMTAFAEGVDVVTASADALDVIGVNTPDELARAEQVFHGQHQG